MENEKKKELKEDTPTKDVKMVIGDIEGGTLSSPKCNIIQDGTACTVRRHDADFCRNRNCLSEPSRKPESAVEPSMSSEKKDQLVVRREEDAITISADASAVEAPVVVESIPRTE